MHLDWKFNLSWVINFDFLPSITEAKIQTFDFIKQMHLKIFQIEIYK